MTALRIGVPLAACVAMLCAAPAQAQQAAMSFFVTSAGPGKGADLGGLAGADKHCQTLAATAGAGSKTWHAYLSTQGAGAVNARDRIGKGPWTNAKGVIVAASVDDLHSASNKLSKQNNLSEKGEVINGRGDKPNRHDILTGSTADGKAIQQSVTAGAAQVGLAAAAFGTARGMRGVPGMGFRVIAQALAVVMAEHDRTLRAARVVLAGHVLVGRKGFAVHRRAGEDVMPVRLVAAAVDHFAFFRKIV